MQGFKDAVKILKLIQASYKILLAAFIILVLLFSLLYLFVLFAGKNILVRQIEKAARMKASVGNFSVSPPLNLIIKKLDIQGLAKVEDISLSPSIPLLLTGHLAFNKVTIISPQVTFENKPAVVSSGAAASASKEKKRIPIPRIIIKHLVIKDGRVDFSDPAVGPQGIKITVKDINFTLHDLGVLPFSSATDFELSGKIPWQEGQDQGKISLQGWINLAKKDMQATLKIEDIDGVYLYPYYSTWVDLEKARIEKAKLNFSSDIQGFKNDITAQCHLELSDIVRKPREEGEPEEKAEKITDAVLDMFKAFNQGKISLDFTIRTKMDKPQFGFGDIKSAFEVKLSEGRKGSVFSAEGALGMPAKIVEGVFKGATDLTNAVISGTISAGKEIGKTVEGALKKEGKPAEEAGNPATPAQSQEVKE